MIEITDKTIGKLQDTILVEFYTSWCGPCKRGVKNLRQFEENTGCKTGKVDFQKNPKLLNMYTSNGLPLYILFIDGKPTKRKVGIVDLEKEFGALL